MAQEPEKKQNEAKPAGARNKNNHQRQYSRRGRKPQNEVKEDVKPARQDEAAQQKPRPKKNADQPAGDKPKRNQPAQKQTNPRDAVAQAAKLAASAVQKVVTKSDSPRSEKPARRQDKKAQSEGPRLKIIPLGGLNEIGKNMTVIEYENDIVVIDCGMTFPDDELLGVDLVIPDTSYLVKNLDKVRGFVITHAHEDHIGALPYVLRDVNVPIYCTSLTAGLVSLRLTEHRALKKPKIHVKKAGDRFKLGAFEIEMIHVNHSVPDSCAIAVKTPVGTIIDTGDFKIDTTPVDGKMIDLERFGQLGRQGVLLLMCDSTNAERAGFTMSERKVGESFEREFKGCEKRVIIATFASNVHRIQQIIDVAAKSGRKVAVTGRSMDNILKVGVELGYIKLPENTLIDIADIKKYPDNKLTIITTGSQGEAMSALYRMAFGAHRQIDVGYGDKILVAANPIPGNEKPVYTMINELFRRGAEVVYERLADIHVSGHACQEEIKTIISLTRPKFYMPVHGEYRHLMVNATLGRACGVKPENIYISDLGRVLETDGNDAWWGESIPAGRILVDGYGVGDVGTAVLRERRHLSQDGIITAVATVDVENGTILSGPEVYSRGFIFVREAEELMGEMRDITRQALEGCFERHITSRPAIRDAIASRLSEHLRKKTKRDPIVLPVVMET